MVSAARIIARGTALRTPDRHLGRRLHNGRNVDAIADFAGKRRTASNKFDLPTLRIDRRIDLARGFATWILFEIGNSKKFGTKSNCAPENLRRRSKGPAVDRPNADPESRGSNRRQRGAGRGIFLDRTFAAEFGSTFGRFDDVDVRIFDAPSTPGGRRRCSAAESAQSGAWRRRTIDAVSRSGLLIVFFPVRVGQDFFGPEFLFFAFQGRISDHSTKQIYRQKVHWKHGNIR